MRNQAAGSDNSNNQGQCLLPHLASSHPPCFCQYIPWPLAHLQEFASHHHAQLYLGLKIWPLITQVMDQEP